MESAEWARHLAGLEGVEQVVAPNGDSFYFYDPDRVLPSDRRMPFSTIVHGNDYDNVSALDRPGVFRLNLGVSKSTFREAFGEGDAEYDFAAIDQPLPHPVYGKMYWVCVLNPGARTSDLARAWIADAYVEAARRYRPRA